MSAKVMHNLESIGDLIGAFAGISEGLDQPRYIEGLIHEAHGEAAHAFDLAAAAAGQAGAIKHVYEFGVPGITRGDPKFADPASPAARLYQHRITGTGGRQDIGFNFRPATAPNPQPTTESTGVPSKYLAKLSKRKYIFWNKAFVMESGQHVDIASRQTHGLLFVPTPGENAPRGYIMYPAGLKGPIRAQPGRSTRGTFGAFWIEWWASQGQAIMDGSMREAVMTDTKLATQAMLADARSTRMQTPLQTNIAGAAARAASKIKKFYRPRYSGRHVK